jgi:hypothetical protein
VSELQGIARFTFHEGKLEEFKRLAARCMAIVRTNNDQSECVVLERYRDSEALIEHGAHLGELGQAILATGSVTSACLGEPSAVLGAQLAGSGVQLFTCYLSL